MSQNVELAKVKLRIKQYLERTVDRGFTENEALIAAQKLGELIEQYNINLSELDLAEESCVQKSFDVFGHNKTPIDGMIVSIARFTNTRCWFTRGFDLETFKDVVHYNYFGLESDTDMAVWLTDTLNRTLENETAAFKKTDTYKNTSYSKRSASTSFQKGFSSRVYRRLLDLKAQNDEFLKREAEKRTVQTGVECKSLIVVKEDKVNKEFDKLGLHLGRGTAGTSARDGAAWNAGHSAGGRANLNRPVGGSSQALIGRS